MNKQVRIGELKIGGRNPVRIKGMLKSSTSEPRKLIREAKSLEKEGAEAIRLAVRQTEDAKLLKILKKHVSLPLVADIHFHPKLALLAIEEGFEGIRLNPLNIPKKKDVEKIAKLAKRYKTSIRVGVNSGGFKKDFSSVSLAKEMVKKALKYVAVLERVEFFDIMISIKAADVVSTIAANEMLSKKCNYPLHLGVTASGPFSEGITKSAVGLGNLLYRGIGNVIRVSLTAPSFWEIRAAKYILQSLNLRKFGPEIISCPTCSRCEVDLMNIVERFKKNLGELQLDKPLRIALMGCVVNGPGEAYQADIGVAFGKKRAVIFRKNKILGQSNDKKVVADLIEVLRKECK